MLTALLLASFAGTLPSPSGQVAQAIQSAMSSAKAPKSGRLAMRIELFADPDGKVIDCAIRAHTGSERAARAVCRAAKDKKIQPAANSQGAPSFGLAVFNVGYGNLRGGAGLGDLPQVPLAADVVLQIAEYPAGADGPVRVKVIVGAGPDGVLLRCAQQVGHVALTDLACERVEAIRMPVRNDKSGAPVSYVAPLEVEFTTAPLPPA